MRPVTFTENWPDPLRRTGCGCPRCASGELNHIVKRTLTVAQRHAQNRFDVMEQDAAGFNRQMESVTRKPTSGAAAHYGNLIVVRKRTVSIPKFLTDADSQYKGPNRQWVYRFFLTSGKPPGCTRQLSPLNRPFYIGRVSRRSATGLKDRINEHIKRGKALLEKLDRTRSKVKSADDAVALAGKYRRGEPVFSTKLSGSQLFDFILASLLPQFCIEISEVCLSRGADCKAPPGASLLIERAHIFSDNAHINRPFEEEDEEEFADAVANLAIMDLRR